MRLFLLVVSILFLLSHLCGCLDNEPEAIMDSASLDLLHHAEIAKDGYHQDWGGIDPIYEDPEKSLCVVTDDDDAVFGVRYAAQDPSHETYYFGIDKDFDYTEDYLIEINRNDASISEKKGSEWVKFGQIESNAMGIIEFKVPLDVLGNGFFFTGWVYDKEKKLETAHFPWVRSLCQDLEFGEVPMTTNDYLEDFEALYYLVRYNYPYLYEIERNYGYNWLDKKEEYIDRIKECQTDEEFLSIVNEAVMTLQNGHTDILTSSWLYLANFGINVTDEIEVASEHWESLWPTCCPDVLFKRFGGEYIAIDGIGDWEEKYSIGEGTRLLQVDGVDIDVAVSGFAEKVWLRYCPSDGSLYQRHICPSLFGEDAIYSVMAPGGTVKDIKIGYSSDCSWKDTYESLYEYYGSEKDNVEASFMEDESVAYIKIRSFQNEKWHSIDDLMENVLEYDNLIIDIRENGGGNVNFWLNDIVGNLIEEDLNIKYCKAFRQGKFAESLFADVSMENPENAPPEVFTDEYRVVEDKFWASNYGDNSYGGNIYLLVDDGSASASDRFAKLSKKTGFATVVGTHTSGGGFDRIACFYLPNSKIVVRMAYCMGINDDGSVCMETAPNIYVKEEYGNGDEVLDYVLSELIGIN